MKRKGTRRMEKPGTKAQKRRWRKKYFPKQRVRTTREIPATQKMAFLSFLPNARIRSQGSHTPTYPKIPKYKLSTVSWLWRTVSRVKSSGSVRRGKRNWESERGWSEQL